MHRFATPIVKLAFEGPEIHEEVLYDLFRVSTPPSSSRSNYLELVL